MTEIWQTQEERGSSSLIRLIAWIALNLGHRFGHLLLYPICLYFLAFSVQARRASAIYLERVLGKKPGIADLFRHYFCFASTILDRPYFLTGRFDAYDIRIHGAAALEAIHRSGEGAILMGAHIGSFDVLRCLARDCDWIDLKIMMYPELSKKISLVLNEINPSYAKDVIPLGRPDSVIDAYSAIRSGKFVGILGDRNSKGGKCITLPFLGREAMFPQGPMMLAAAANCPVISFFAIYRGGKRYDIYFDLLCERVPRDYRTNPDSLREPIQEFARRMEQRCIDAPYNWFNFYDFWKGNAS